MPRTSDDDPFGHRDQRRAEALRGDASRDGGGGGGGFDVMEAIDMMGRRLGGAILLAGAFIAFGLYTGSGGENDGPKYQAFAADGEVFRLNTESGTLIACNANRCTRILQRGQDLAEDQGETLFKAPPAPQIPAGPQDPGRQAPGAQLPIPVPQLPAPGPQPAAPAAPSPQEQPAAPR